MTYTSMFYTLLLLNVIKTWTKNKAYLNLIYEKTVSLVEC